MTGKHWTRNRIIAAQGVFGHQETMIGRKPWGKKGPDVNPPRSLSS
jgi:hypothetical protein